MNVASWIDRAGRAYPTQPAIAVGHDVTLTYRDLARRCALLASGLLTRYQLSPGDRVAVVASNHRCYLESLFGVWWAGLVAVPVNAKLHASEVQWIVEHCGARVAFVSPDLAPTLGGLSGVEVLAFEDDDYEQLLAGAPAPIASCAADDLAWLFYTSGTTGRPKGAMLTHRNLTAMSLACLAEVDPTAPDEALYHAAPMSHGSGLYALPHVCRAAVNVIPESGSFDAVEVLEFVQSRPGVSMFAAPTMVRRLVECPTDLGEGAFRSLIWGGAPMLVPDVVRALDRFGPCLTQIYGQGETPMTISVLAKRDIADRAHERWLERLGSAGTVNSAVEVRITPDSEILVRGDTVMRGYWDNPEATARALEGGWLHTGDIGTFDDDGFLHLHDRATDLIISGGSNIYPREVEEVLVAHEDVAEVSVIGRPDPEWGEVVVAYVVGDAAVVELDQLCLDRIARFKRPKEYVFVEALPKNNYGKVLKTELRTRDAESAGIVRTEA